jgi:hypothetical protein
MVEDLVESEEQAEFSLDSTWNFVEYVRKEMSKSADLDKIHGSIERAYDQYVSSNPNGPPDKASFLLALSSCDPKVYEMTVNYLFTPIKWSNRQMHRLYGIQDEASGNLITVCVDEPGKVYSLHLCDDEEHDPMLLTTQEAADTFMKVFEYQAKIASLMDVVSAREDESLVILKIDKDKISLGNLKIVEVDLIF